MAELGFGESLKFQLEKRLEPWHRIFEPLVPQATVRGDPVGESPPHGAATGRRVPTGVAAGSRLRFPTGLHRPRSLAAAPCCFGPIALEGERSAASRSSTSTKAGHVMILPVNGSAAIVVLRCFMFGPVDIEKAPPWPTTPRA
jgi:hypothetical protein